MVLTRTLPLPTRIRHYRLKTVQTVHRGSWRSPLTRVLVGTPWLSRVAGVDKVSVQVGWSPVTVHRSFTFWTVVSSQSLSEGRVPSGGKGVQGDRGEGRELTPANADVPPRDPEPTRRRVRDPIPGCELEEIKFQRRILRTHFEPQDWQSIIDDVNYIDRRGW